MTRIKEKVIEEIKLLPEDVLESVADFVEYVKIHRTRAEELELKYGSFDKLGSKVTSEEHTWEEERDFFEWEAALTEVKKIKRILKVE